MSSYEPSSTFHDAANFLSTAPSSSNASTNTKLELYGLFKLLTVSPKPTSPRPGLFDFAGRAKWDSWNTIGGQYADRAPAAEQRYLAIARELGWHERKPGQEESSQTPDAAEPGEKRGSGSAAGMGVHVSTVTFEEDQGREEGSLHGLAISGDVQGVKNYIQKHPDTDLNAKDEHGYTLLHLAADRGHVALTQLLLESGVDRDIEDPDEFTALELAQVAQHEDVVSLLQSK